MCEVDTNLQMIRFIRSGVPIVIYKNMGIEIKWESHFAMYRPTVGWDKIAFSSTTHTSYFLSSPSRTPLFLFHFI